MRNGGLGQFRAVLVNFLQGCQILLAAYESESPAWGGSCAVEEGSD